MRGDTEEARWKARSSTSGAITAAAPAVSTVHACPASTPSTAAAADTSGGRSSNRARTAYRRRLAADRDRSRWCSRCGTAMTAACRSASRAPEGSGSPSAAAHRDPRISSPARTATARRSGNRASAGRCTTSPLAHSVVRKPLSASSVTRQLGTRRPRIVSLRSGSAVSAVGEYARTFDSGSSTVIAPPTSAASARASPGRSPSATSADASVGAAAPVRAMAARRSPISSPHSIHGARASRAVDTSSAASASEGAIPWVPRRSTTAAAPARSAARSTPAAPGADVSTPGAMRIRPRACKVSPSSNTPAPLTGTSVPHGARSTSTTSGPTTPTACPSVGEPPPCASAASGVGEGRAGKAACPKCHRCGPA